MANAIPGGAVCVPNISRRERRKRLGGGAVAFGAGLGAYAALAIVGAPRPWRLVLLPLFWSAASGFFQWRDRT